MAYWEPPGEDPMEIHVADAELLIDMTEDDIVESAASMEMSVAEYRRWRDWRIEESRRVSPEDLSPDQYRRLFRQEPAW